MQPGMTPTVRAEMTSATPETATPNLIDAVLAQIQQRLGPKRFGVWFDGKIRLSIADARLTVNVANPFVLNWMKKQFRNDMKAAAQMVLGPSAEANFAVDATLAQPTNGQASPSAKQPVERTAAKPEPPKAPSNSPA